LAEGACPVSNEVIYLLVMLVLIAVALAYNLYQLWFKPEEYVRKFTMSVGDWWPFADFYRRWFSSKAFLWLFRIVYMLWFLGVLLILSLWLLGLLGLFP
jgi:hypothetical protein